MTYTTLTNRSWSKYTAYRIEAGRYTDRYLADTMADARKWAREIGAAVDVWKNSNGTHVASIAAK